MSIFAKYTLAILGLLLLAAGSVTGLSLATQRSALRAEALLRARTVASNLASGVAEAVLTRDPVTMISLAVDAPKSNLNVVYAAVLDEKGIVLAHPDRELVGKPFSLDQLGSSQGLGSGVREAVANGVRVWDVEAPVTPRGSMRNLGTVHIGLSRKAVEDQVQAAFNALLLASGLILALGVGLSFILVKLLVDPIRRLSSAAAAVGAGDLTVQVPVHSKDEMGRLFETFNSMVANLDQGQQVKLEQERIQGELNVARSIQANLLPDTAPKYSKLDVAFHCAPAKELGGDFFDWFAIGDGKKLGLVIADVSGKGVPAAIHMANLRNLIRFVAREQSDPTLVMKKVNELAWPDLKGESFVTVIYAVLDIETREVEFVSAGHEPALRISASGHVEECRAKGMPVGIAEAEDFDTVIKSSRLKLEPGDTFVLFTDGVTEAMNSKSDQFGREKLHAVLSQAKSRSSADALVKSVVNAVNLHADGQEQSDDLTLIVVKTG